MMLPSLREGDAAATAASGDGAGGGGESGPAARRRPVRVPPPNLQETPIGPISAANEARALDALAALCAGQVIERLTRVAGDRAMDVSRVIESFTCRGRTVAFFPGERIVDASRKEYRLFAAMRNLREME